MCRWERAEEVRERAEEEARGGSGAAGAGTSAQAQAMPADAALSIRGEAGVQAANLCAARGVQVRLCCSCQHAVHCTHHLTLLGTAYRLKTHNAAATLQRSLPLPQEALDSGRVIDASVHQPIGGCGGQKLMCEYERLC